MLTLAEGYRAAVISMLLRMMDADGHKDRIEYSYVLKVAYEMGMTPEDIAALTLNTSTGKVNCRKVNGIE